MIDVSTLKVGDVIVPIEEIGLDSYQKINNAAHYQRIWKGSILLVTGVEEDKWNDGLCVNFHYLTQEEYKNLPTIPESKPNDFYMLGKPGTFKRRFNYYNK